MPDSTYERDAGHQSMPRRDLARGISDLEPDGDGYGKIEYLPYGYG
jgi:hypothetical protein